MKSKESLRHCELCRARCPISESDRDVSQLRPLHVDALYTELRKGGTSEHKIRKAHKTLSVSINRAIKYGWCQSNPCAAADKPQVRTAEIAPPTPERVREIIAAQGVVNEDTATCFRLAAATGMRRGELVGLQRRDVKGQSISIRRSLVWDTELKVDPCSADEDRQPRAPHDPDQREDGRSGGYCDGTARRAMHRG